MRASCEDISPVDKMHESEDFSSFLKGQKPSSNAEVTHSEKGKQLAVQAPIFLTESWGLTLDLASALQGSCLLPPSAAHRPVLACSPYLCCTTLCNTPVLSMQGFILVF